MKTTGTGWRDSRSSNPQPAHADMDHPMQIHLLEAQLATWYDLHQRLGHARKILVNAAEGAERDLLRARIRALQCDADSALAAFSQHALKRQR